MVDVPLELDDGDCEHVLLDESGAHASGLVAVGALLTPNLRRLEEQVAAHHEEKSADPWAGSAKSLASLREDGFHFAVDDVAVKNDFLLLLSRMTSFRSTIAFSRRERLASITDDERCLVLYRAILPSIIGSARRSKLHFVFETNQALNRRFGALLEDSLADPLLSRSRSLPSVSYSISGKKDVRALAIADYCLGVTRHWLEDGAREDNARVAFRNFSRIRSHMSVILNFDTGERWTRRTQRFS